MRCNYNRIPNDPHKLPTSGYPGENEQKEKLAQEQKAKKEAEQARRSAEIQAEEEEKRFMARARLAFSKLDEDGSEFLDEEEILKALETLGMTGNELKSQVEEIITAVGSEERGGEVGSRHSRHLQLVCVATHVNPCHLCIRLRWTLTAS